VLPLLVRVEWVQALGLLEMARHRVRQQRLLETLAARQSLVLVEVVEVAG
jgi:hypothetical protein